MGNDACLNLKKISGRWVEGVAIETRGHSTRPVTDEDGDVAFREETSSADVGFRKTRLPGVQRYEVPAVPQEEDQDLDGAVVVVRRINVHLVVGVGVVVIQPSDVIPKKVTLAVDVDVDEAGPKLGILREAPSRDGGVGDVEDREVGALAEGGEGRVGEADAPAEIHNGQVARWFEKDEVTVPKGFEIPKFQRDQMRAPGRQFQQLPPLQRPGQCIHITDSYGRHELEAQLPKVSAHRS